MSHWEQKKVVILGGSQGLGRKLAEAWYRQGADVTIVARDPVKLAAAEAKIEPGPSQDAKRMRTFTADVTNVGDVERLFGQLEEIDVLVNAFGRSDRGRAVETSADKYAELLDLNFIAVTSCVAAAIDALKRSRGSIVNIGSLASKSVSPYLGAYPASKFALAAYTAQLRLELAEDGIHTLLVCPGPIRRSDAGGRYDRSAQGLPDSARKPGGGVKLQGIDPVWLAQRIIRACELRQVELVVPAKSRLLFAISQLSPTLGDWIVRKMTS